MKYFYAGWQLPVIRALLALSVSLGLASFCLEEYASMLLRVIEHALAFWSPEFRVLDIQVLSKGRDTVIEAVLLVREYFVFYGRVIPAGGTINTSTLAGHMLVHVVLLTTLLAAWPASSLRSYLARLLLALPALVLLAWLDVPLIMTGSMHALILESLAPESLPTARFVLAMQFLENGGRYLLILLLGSAVILVSSKLCRQS